MNICMTNWIYIMKTILESRQSKNQLREKLLNNCLASQKKFLGSYIIDAEKVWTEIIMKDPSKKNKLNMLGFSNVYDVMSYYEEIQYKQMRSTYPRRHHKRGA